MRTPLSFLASCALLVSSSIAWSQGVPPDVVKLRDGSMYRGTISELVANDHVDLLTADGQSRHFAMKDVAYAGSASPPPTAPPPPPPPPPGPQPLITLDAQRADLRFEANEPEVQFQLRTGQAETAGIGMGWRTTYTFSARTSAYTTICTAPCSAAIPTGTHRIGLSQGDGPVVEPDEPVVVRGPGTLQGVYTSHRAVRIAGLVVDLVSIGVGTALALTSYHTTNVCDGDGFCSDQGQINGTQLGIGLGVLVVGTIVGTVMMYQKDGAEISFVPMSPVASSAAKELASLRAPGAPPQGMALQVRF